jgi:hypothetical protein
MPQEQPHEASPAIGRVRSFYASEEGGGGVAPPVAPPPGPVDASWAPTRGAGGPSHSRTCTALSPPLHFRLFLHFSQGRLYHFTKSFLPAQSWRAIFCRFREYPRPVIHSAVISEWKVYRAAHLSVSGPGVVVCFSWSTPTQI